MDIEIGYKDIVEVGGKIIKKKGKEVEVVEIWMVIYMGIRMIV